MAPSPTPVPSVINMVGSGPKNAGTEKPPALSFTASPPTNSYSSFRALLKYNFLKSMVTESQGGRTVASPASAGLLLMLLALPPAAPSCPMLCTCYSSPPTVSCQANNFSSVPLSLPPSTQRLFLQNNLIRTLRPGTFGPSLLTLWLFSNNLSTIYPGTFRHLQALEELDLGDNRHLRSLEPDTFQGLERLQSLHLYRCQLSSLPGNIFRGLVSLQYLYLQENSLLHLQEVQQCGLPFESTRLGVC
ncbi:reticulon-4 receptor-like 2 [Puma concolor]|uniref:Reticulon-4 receptor-like 2 n=1 Tax=Puma concolor TaxID=9696 RepID=A0A6P6I6Z4_PUMCO|nr:reticulon-4 receptor-like 2 [Puma concolor]